MNNNHNLTPKEQEVLAWLSEGKSTADIAILLAIGSRTVKFHISNIMRKLNAENRTHAVVIAIDQGLIKRIVSRNGPQRM